MRRTALQWAAGAALVAVYAVGIAAHWYLALAVVSILVLAAVPVLGVASTRATRARQERVFLETYGSLDGARAALDLPALRAARDTDGVVPTVRALRRSHPDIPLAQAAEIVRGL